MYRILVLYQIKYVCIDMYRILYILSKIKPAIMRTDLHFDIHPDTSSVWDNFPESPYFSEKALTHAWLCDSWSGIILACVGDRVLGALLWKLPPKEKLLKIDAVEVHPEFRGQWVGPWLIFTSERINAWRFHSSYGYLNDRGNEASLRMFLAAWYTRKDEQKLYKIFP